MYCTVNVVSMNLKIDITDNWLYQISSYETEGNGRTVKEKILNENEYKVGLR